MEANWVHVARKDFADAIRSKTLWALSVVMIAFALVGMYAPHAFDENPDVEAAVAFLNTPMLILVPILGLIVGYMAIVGERDTGSIKFLLGLPIVRWEVLVGKFVGRSLVLAVPILLGFAIAVPLVVVLYGDFPVWTYLMFVALSVLTAIVFVAIAVGISASVSSRGKAMASVIGVFVLFEYLWGLIPTVLYYLLNGEFPGVDAPNWYEFVLQFSPGLATMEFVDFVYDREVSSDVPVYLQEWFSGIIVALWIVLPLAIGYVRFKRTSIS